MHKTRVNCIYVPFLYLVPISFVGKKKVFPNIWGNPRSVWFAPTNEGDILRAYKVQRMIGEKNIHEKMAELCRYNGNTPIFNLKNDPGAKGLRRVLKAEHFGEKDRLVHFMDFEVTRSSYYLNLQIDDFRFEKIKQNGSDFEGSDTLFSFLKNLNVLDSLECTDIQNFKLTSMEETNGLAYMGEMHGKLSHNSNPKKFVFFSGEKKTFKFNIKNRIFKASIGINRREESAYVKLMRLSAESTNAKETLSGNVNEIIFFFDKKPKLVIKHIHHPDVKKMLKAEEEQKARTRIEKTYPELLSTQTIDLSNNLLKYFDNAFASIRYVNYVKPHTNLESMIPYQAYFSNVVHAIHTTAKLQYVYSVMCSVTSALIREKYPGSKALLPWNDLMNGLKRALEARANYEQGLISWNIQRVANLASSLYKDIVGVSDVASQLEALYTSDCLLDKSKLSSLDFGHLLATFLFVNSPLHVISKLESRNDNKTEKTFFCEKQKLFVYKISNSNTPLPYDHGTCWTFNAVIGSKREYLFDLEDIMIPGSKMKRIEAAREKKEISLSQHGGSTKIKSQFIKKQQARYYLAMEAGGVDPEDVAPEQVDLDLTGNTPMIPVEVDPEAPLVPASETSDSGPHYWAKNFNCTHENNGPYGAEDTIGNLISVDQRDTNELQFSLFVPCRSIEGYASKSAENEGGI